MAMRRVKYRQDPLTRSARLGVLVAWGISAILAVAHAETGQTNVIDGVSTNAGATFTIGNSGPFNALIITNGGMVTDTTGIIGNLVAASNNIAVITGSGSVWTNTGNLTIGDAGAGNRMTVAHGGAVYNAAATIGFGAGAINGSVLVTGSGSLWQSSSTLVVGRGGYGSQLVISNGGTVVETSTSTLGMRVGEIAAGSNSSILVTGSGSVLDNAGTLIVGYVSASNRLLISNGGKVTSLMVAGRGADASNNVVEITGPNSELNVGGVFTLGQSSQGNQLIVSNGGRAVLNQLRVGFGIAASNNAVVVTGAGSLLETTSLFLGTNGTTDAIGGSVLVTGGGTLHVDSLLRYGVNGSGTLTNIGGVYQFGVANLNISLSTPGSMVVSNGTISFRGINNANVHAHVQGAANNLTNVAFFGNNTFRLNSSSNLSSGQDYTFDTAFGPTNYARLELVNEGALWRSARLDVGANGSLLASNTVATVAAVVTNAGAIRVVNSKITWSSNMVVRGSYVSDPSTNTFLGNVTVEPSGTLAGGAGDRFDFQRSLSIQSTNAAGFDLSRSIVAFTGGGAHTNTVTGGDFGTNFFPAANFAYGALEIGVTDDLFFLSGGHTNGGALANALYVNHLMLPGDDPGFVANLHSPFNIYYLLSEHQAGNAYLGDLTYSLDGGGKLIPVVPEPTAAVLVMLAVCAMLGRRTEKWLMVNGS
jgi:fibronectin-binding autotransporter adhesin